jgi:hypothetical protein
MISIGEIIYRINENPLLRSVKKSDIVNHIKTVISLIGVPILKEDKLVVLEIIDYRAQLPSDFIRRKSVRVLDGTDRIVLSHMTDEYGKFSHELSGTIDDTDHIFTHKIVEPYIYTDFKEGRIELLYYAYILDENGWPMIPNNESLIKAIDYYIRSRHYEILADQNAQFERAYQRAEQQYCWYVAQATNSLLQPDPVEAQAIGAMLTRLVPMKDNFYLSDKYAGQPERINRKVW